MSAIAAARDALQAIRPDLPRDEWVRAGMAAQSAGLDFEDFNDWSSGAGNYSERDARDAWRSFKPGKGVGAGTLFKLATENGWRMGAVKPTTRPAEPPRKPSAGMGAADIWERCEPVTLTHPYITQKNAAGVPLGGLRVVPAGDSLRIAGQSVAGFLVVPAHAPDGTLQSAQFIPVDGGKKLNLPGASMAGATFTLGTDGPAYLCEGFGQAAAIWQATGHRAVCCFGWGNVRRVAEAMRQCDASARLVICPDVGKESDAEKIALEVGAAIAAMPAGWPQNGDVNDLAKRDGGDALAELLERATEPPARKPTSADYVPDGVVLTCGSDLTPEPVRWLWPAWLALGKLHILAGAPGQGKTTIAMSMAATVTIGGRWPDGSRCEPGNVLIWSGEDDAADTLLPRLLAAGADRARCFFISGSRIDGEVRNFDPATDMGQLLAAVEKIGGIKLLVVDPVVNVVTGDSHKNTEVRRAMQPLVDLAAACDCALLGITHFSKGGQGSEPLQRVIGSVAFAAVARVVLVAAKVRGDDDKDTRILARSKSNIGPDDGGFEYFMEQIEVDAFPGIEAARIAWGRAVEGNARELLTDPDEGTTDSNDVCNLLRSELAADRWASADAAAKPLKSAGFSKKQIWNASKKLQVVRKKDGMGGGWLWRLPWNSPEDSSEGSEDSNILNRESSESSGHVESSSSLPPNFNLSGQLGQLVHPSNVGQVGQHEGQVDFQGLESSPSLAADLEAF